MGKIIKFKSKSDNLVEYLEDLIKKVKENKIDNIAVAMKTKKEDAYVMTGYFGLDLCEKQELLSHMQLDIVNEMVYINYFEEE